MFAKVRSAANWLLPLKIQAFPGDFGELSRHLETHHNMNLTKSARFQEAQSSHPPFFFCGASPTTAPVHFKTGKVSASRI